MRVLALALKLTPVLLLTFVIGSVGFVQISGGPSGASAADCSAGGGTLTNGTTDCGAILVAAEIDTWTFTATTGDRIGVEVGEITDNNQFTPWIRLLDPDGTSLDNINGHSGAFAAELEALAPTTGTYQVLVASADGGHSGTGTYRLTMTHTPGPITVSDGDEGGPLTNGAMHTGAISTGDLDVWTFTATAGDHIGVEAGEITGDAQFTPWIRIWAPSGTSLGNINGNSAPFAASLDVTAPATGTYLVLVASADGGHSGTGTYRLTMTHTPGPITVSDGDEGGPLTNGAMHTGAISTGDLDVWTFTATAGDHIGVEAGEITGDAQFTPWIRIWAPSGTSLGNINGNSAPFAASLDVTAPATGTYLVLVASADGGHSGTGTYRLTMTHTPGPITVSDGDEGGPLTNGAMHTGAISTGDLDVWTFTATAGDHIGVEAGEITGDAQFTPWIRIWAPSGTSLGNINGNSAPFAASLDVTAPATGTYLVLVASADGGHSGTGTYRLTMTHTPGPITVSDGDEGGPLTNGAMHTGAISTGDLDVWTFTATAGNHIIAGVGEITDTGSFLPWIRIWAPGGTSLGNINGNSGPSAASLDVTAPATGLYLVLIASADGGHSGTGTYQLTVTGFTSATATPTPTATSVGQTPTPTATPTLTATVTATPCTEPPAPTDACGLPTPTTTPVGQTPTLTPSPTPEGQTPSPTPVPTATPSPTPEGQTPGPTPTPSPTAAPGQRIWGDDNCSGEADPVDSLLTLRFDAGLSTNTGDCPPMGEVVEVGEASPHPWGDVDCGGDVNPVDSLKLLRFDAGLDVAQADGCPELGTTVTIQ